MSNKYKLEVWKKINWKGTKRQTETTIEKLVMRDLNGRFVKNKPIIDTIQIKNYGTGIYRVGKVKGRIKVRQKISSKSPEWFTERKDIIDGRKIFRASYVLNNIPISVSSQYFKYADRSSRKSWTIGFRINAYSHSQNRLNNLKPKLKQRLIKWVEECLKYNQSEFWFDSYYGWEAPSISNASKSDNGNYYLTLENMRGTIVKQDSGKLRELE